MQESYNPSGPVVLTCHFNLLPLPVSLSTAREMGLPFVWAVDRLGWGGGGSGRFTKRGVNPLCKPG